MAISFLSTRKQIARLPGTPFYRSRCHCQPRDARNGVFGVACEKIGHIFIDRSNREKAIETIETAKKKIVGGTSVLFFPEGTRSETGELKKFKKGAFWMAVDLHLPILPVSIEGTAKILPAKSVLAFPGRATLTVHPPIDTSGYDASSIDALIQSVRDALQ